MPVITKENTQIWRRRTTGQSLARWVAGLSGQHSLVLFEPSSGMMVRQEISIGTFALPVTGPSETSNDLVVSLALFLLVFGVLGREINRKKRPSRP